MSHACTFVTVLFVQQGVLPLYNMLSPVAAMQFEKPE